MNGIPLGNYATVLRNFGQYSPTALGAEKSQTVSGKSRELPAAGLRPFKKVGTVSAQLDAPQSPAILSISSVEFSQSKIQTLSGKFRRRRLRNSASQRREEAGYEILQE
jgi:hypothetical protein